MQPMLVIQDGEASDPEKEAKSARTLTGRCWMAEGFPMSLRQLLPILDIVGTANKHLARVAKFMQKYGDMELFPVKLQVLTQAHSCTLVHEPRQWQPGIRVIAARAASHVLAGSQQQMTWMGEECCRGPTDGNNTA